VSDANILGGDDDLLWLICDHVTGDVLAEMPLAGDSAAKGLSGAGESAGSWSFAPGDAPGDWRTLIDPDDARRLVVAVHRGTPVQAWVVTDVDTGGTTPTIGGPTLGAAVLGRVYVRSYEAYNTDEATICGDILGQVVGPEHNFRVLVTASGTPKDVYYDGTVDLTLDALLEEYKTSTPSIDYVVDVDWEPGHEGRRVRKTIRVGPTDLIGRADPDMVIDGSAILDASRKKSHAEGQGATRLWAVTDGSGESRPIVGPFESEHLATTGPWESRESFATVEDEVELGQRGQTTLADRANGTAVWEITCALDKMPKVVASIDAGDTVTFEIDPNETEPDGGTITGVLLAWDVDFGANTFKPTIKVGGGSVALIPTRDGARQLWGTIDELRSWRQQMRSSHGVLNRGTVTRPGGIVVKDQGSIISQGPAYETRLNGGVTEVRKLPDGPWKPLANDILEQVPDHITDGNPPPFSPEPSVLSFIGVLVVNWQAVPNADLVTYDVHASTVPDFQPSADTLAGTLAGTMLYVRSTAGGGPLEYSTDYYVRLVARDPDGAAEPSAPVLGQASQVALEDIVAGAITAELFAAVLVLASTIKLGDLITISVPEVDQDGKPVGGIIVRDPANPTGTPLVQLHPLGCRFKGELVTDLLTVMDQARIVAELLLGTGSQTILENGVPNPDQAPSLAVSPEATTDWPAPPPGWVQRGITWDTVDSTWLRLLWNSSQKRIAVQKVSTSGVVTSWVNTDDGLDFVNEVSSILRIGSSLYLCVRETFSTGSRSWRISRYNIAGARLKVTTFVAEGSCDGTPALGLDGTTGDIVVVYASVAQPGRLVAYRYDTSGTYTERAFLADRISYTGSINLRAAAISAFDFGTPQLWVAGIQLNLFASFPGWSTPGGGAPLSTENTAHRFDIDAATINAGGAAWKSTGANAGRFYSTSADQTLTRWGNYRPANDTNWTARYADTNAGQSTAASPDATIAVPARRVVTLTLPAAPTGVSGADVWVGYTDPKSSVATTLYKRAEPLSAGRSMMLTGKDTTGSTALPADNTMAGDPAIFRTRVYGPKYDEGAAIWGNGTHKGLAPLAGDVTGLVPGNGVADFPILFSTPFSVPPKVSVTIGDVDNPVLVGACWRNVTTDGFTLRIQRNAANDRTHTASWSATAAR
jgi:hypothetical protein